MDVKKTGGQDTSLQPIPLVSAIPIDGSDDDNDDGGGTT